MIVARIGELDCRIGCCPDDLGGRMLAERLDRLARERLGAALEGALECELDPEPAYHVLREVDVALVARASAAVPTPVLDGTILRAWSNQLARAIAERLRGRAARDGIMTFADETCFLARFLCDLLAGSAWDRWYYGALARYREADVGMTALAVLRGRPAVACAALGALDGRTFDRLLDALEPVGRRSLWALLLGADASVSGAELLEAPNARHRTGPAVPGADPGTSVEPSTLADHAGDWHPLLIVAVQIAGRLGLMPEGTPSGRILVALSQRMPVLIDWRDRESLSEVVLSAMRLLAESGVVRPLSLSTLAAAEVRQTLGGYAWLDRTRLIQALNAWSKDDDRSDVDLPPRLRRLLDDLADITASIEASPSSIRDGAGLKLHLLSRLRARCARWRAEDLAARAVNQLVDATTRLGSAAGTRAEVPGLGEPGRVLVHRLAALLADARPATPSAATLHDALPSACAGLLLLVRALLDVRLLARLATIGAGEAERQHVLFSLAHVFSGLGAAAADDPAVRLFIGADGARAGAAALPPATLSDLARALSVELPALRGWLRPQLVAFRLGESCLLADPDGALWLPHPDTHSLKGTLEALAQLQGSAGATLYLEPGLEQAIGPLSKPFTLVGRLPMDTQVRVEEALAALGASPATVSFDELATYALASTLLRAWAFWLRGFERSSIPYLLAQFVRRPGWLRVGGGRADVWLEPRSLDPVLHRAGYLDPLALPEWRGGGQMCFHIIGDGR